VVEAEALTQREAAIMLQTAHGLSEKEIAANLSISPNTVRAHVENVKRKLHARNKVHAVAISICRSLIVVDL